MHTHTSALLMVHLLAVASALRIPRLTTVPSHELCPSEVVCKMCSLGTGVKVVNFKRCFVECPSCKNAVVSDRGPDIFHICHPGIPPYNPGYHGERLFGWSTGYVGMRKDVFKASFVQCDACQLVYTSDRLHSHDCPAVMLSSSYGLDSWRQT